MKKDLVTYIYRNNEWIIGDAIHICNQKLMSLILIAHRCNFTFKTKEAAEAYIENNM